MEMAFILLICYAFYLIKIRFRSIELPYLFSQCVDFVSNYCFEMCSTDLWLKESRLILTSRPEIGAHGATLVFILKSIVDVNSPIKQIKTEVPLYDYQRFEFVVANPFPAGGVFLTMCHSSHQNCRNVALYDSFRIKIKPCSKIENRVRY